MLSVRLSAGTIGNSAPLVGVSVSAATTSKVKLAARNWVSVP